MVPCFFLGNTLDPVASSLETHFAGVLVYREQDWVVGLMVSLVLSLVGWMQAAQRCCLAACSVINLLDVSMSALQHSPHTSVAHFLSKLGFRRSMQDLKCLFINSIAGVCFVVEWTEFWYTKRKLSALCWRVMFSIPMALIDFLKVWTNHSASLFVAGWCGADWKCLMPFIFMKSVNSSEVNCGQLSLTICSGRPFLEKMFLRTELVLSEIVDFNCITSGHFEWALRNSALL